MEEVFGVIGPIALISAIGTAVVAVICHIIAYQSNQSREEMRVLRVALERDPSPAQLAQAIRMWPEAGKFSPNLQKTELVRRAHEEEGKRAAKTEMIKGLVRTIFFISAFAAALYVASLFLRPRPESPQPANTTTEAPVTN